MFSLGGEFHRYKLLQSNTSRCFLLLAFLIQLSSIIIIDGYYVTTAVMGNTGLRGPTPKAVMERKKTVAKNDIMSSIKPETRTQGKSARLNVITHGIRSPSVPTSLVINNNVSSSVDDTLHFKDQERAEKVLKYWHDRRGALCNDNDPLCNGLLDKKGHGYKSFADLQAEDQLIHTTVPDFIPKDKLKFKEVHLIESLSIFKGEVLNAPKDLLVCVEISASHCKPCKKFQAKYEMFAEYWSKVRFMKFDYDSDKMLSELAKSIGVMKTPSFFLFRNGKVVGKHTGIQDEGFREMMSEALTPDEKP